MEYYLAKGILSYDLIQISNTNGILSDKWNIIMQMESYNMTEHEYQIQLEFYLLNGILSNGILSCKWNLIIWWNTNIKYKFNIILQMEYYLANGIFSYDGI